MIIAKKKREENIAEYIIYMWQVEDTIRAFNFNMEEIDRQIVSRHDQPENTRKEIYDWYSSLAALMKNEKVEKTGHVSFLRNIVNDMNALHLQLLKDPAESEYLAVYNQALPLIRDMNARQQWRSENEIETCLTGVYIYYLMRLRKKEISDATSLAMEVFIKLLGLLSAKYRKREEDSSR